MKIAVLMLLMTVGVRAQTLVDAHTAKGVVSCEKLNWPYKDPNCAGYALAMAHEFFMEHREYFEPAAPKPDAAVVWNTGTISSAPLTTATTPLKCEKYQHEQKTPAHCANTCPPDGISCASVCYFVSEDDRCVDDIHMVTEREWQDLMTRIKLK